MSLPLSGQNIYYADNVRASVCTENWDSKYNTAYVTVCILIIWKVQEWALAHKKKIPSQRLSRSSQA